MEVRDATTAVEHEDRLLNRKEASRELAALGIQLAPSTLAKMLCLGLDGPPYIHIRKRPYYPRLQLRAWARLQVSEVRYSSRELRTAQKGRA